MYLKKALFIILSFLIVDGLFCAKKQSVKVKIGYIKVSSCLPFFVALENGYFKEKGVDVEPVLCANSNEGSNAMIAGQIDGVVGFGLSTLFSIEANTPEQFKIYLPCVETKKNFVNRFLVRKDSKLASIAELKGKKVGTYEGISLLKVLKLILENFMNPDKDVTIIQVPMALQIQSLVTKQFDALFTIEPYATMALEQGVAKVLDENPRVKYVLDPFPAGANAFSTRFLKKDLKLAKKIWQAQIKAVEFIRNNEFAAKKILPKYTPIEGPIAVKSLIYEWWKPEETNQFAIQEYADLMLKTGELKKKIDTKQMLLSPK